MGLPEPSKDPRGSPTLKESLCHRHRAGPGGQPVPPGGHWRLLHLPMLVLFFQVAWGWGHSYCRREKGAATQLLPALRWGQLHQAHTLQQPQPAAHRRRACFHQWRAEQSTTTTFSPGPRASLWISRSASRISADMRRARWGPAASLDFGWERSPSQGPGPGTRKPWESRPGDGVDSATVGLFQAIHQEAGGGVLQDGQMSLNKTRLCHFRVCRGHEGPAPLWILI